EEKSSGVGSLLGDSELFPTTSAAVTEIELLKSRQVIGQAVDNLKLTIVAQPKLFPVIGAFMHRRYQPEPEQPVAEALMGFSSSAWGGREAGDIPAGSSLRLSGRTPCAPGRGEPRFYSAE